MKKSTLDKSLLIKHILVQLEASHQLAVSAALQAYNTATDDENIAENKYDTLGLEASYLAQGQARRVAELENDLDIYSKLSPRYFSAGSPVSIGSLVTVVTNKGDKKYYFLGPAAGGLTLNIDGQEVSVISPSTPLAQSLIGKEIGDEVTLKLNKQSLIFEVHQIN